MMRHLLLVPALLFTSPTLAQHASEEDSAAVLATVDALFETLGTRDPEAMLAVTVPEGRATGQMNARDGTSRMRGMSWSRFAEQLPGFPEGAGERLLDPHVHVDGDIAMIWSDYVFTQNERVVHCGTNHIDLIRTDGTWKVNNLTWTQRTQGCPAAE